MTPRRRALVDCHGAPCARQRKRVSRPSRLANLSLMHTDAAHEQDVVSTRYFQVEKCRVCLRSMHARVQMPGDAFRGGVPTSRPNQAANTDFAPKRKLRAHWPHASRLDHCPALRSVRKQNVGATGVVRACVCAVLTFRPRWDQEQGKDCTRAGLLTNSGQLLRQEHHCGEKNDNP